MPGIESPSRSEYNRILTFFAVGTVKIISQSEKPLCVEKSACQNKFLVGGTVRLLLNYCPENFILKIYI
jgi:hypothetical protein